MTERQGGGDRPRLDRAPGERAAGLRAGGPGAPRGGRAGWSARRALLAAAIVADLGALAFAVVAQVDLGLGLVAVAAFLGWITALALVWRGRATVPDARRRTIAALLLGGWAIALGICLDWAWSLAQGGTLDPLAYAGARYGALGGLAMVVAALVSGWRVR